MSYWDPSSFRRGARNVAHFFGPARHVRRRGAGKLNSRETHDDPTDGGSQGPAREEAAQARPGAGHGPDYAPQKPYLALYLAHEPQGLNFTRAATGEQVPMRMRPDGRAEALASLRNPRREAERGLGTPALNPRAVMVVLGLGNPELLFVLEQRLTPNQIVIVIDASFDLGALLLRDHAGARGFFAVPGRHLFCGEQMQASLWTYVESLPSDGFGGIRFVEHAASVRREPEFYDAIRERLRQLLQSKISDLLTRFEFERHWIRNIIINTNRLPPAPGDETALQRWTGVLAGRPAVLVAAGPSLRESLPVLRALTRKAFVLACDTALKVLLNSGIVPHAVMTLDSQKHTLFHFLGEPDLERLIVFADLVVHPLVLRSISPRALIFSTTAKHTTSYDGSTSRETTPGSGYAEAIAGPLGDVQSGGSVATSAFDLLRQLGADPILLIGQDLAYTGREIHSTGTHHNERWLTLLSRTRSLEHINEAVMRRRELSQVPAIGGGTEPSDYVLQLYRHWFEDAIPRTGVRVLNLTARGARIEGVPAPEDVLDSVDSLPDFPEAGRIFERAPAPRLFEHSAGRQIYRRLREIALAAGPNGSGQLERFFGDHPQLQALRRQAVAYVKRNRTRLDDERGRRVLERYELRVLRELERALRPYFA